MECKIKNRHKLISDYLMGELPDDDAKSFEEHYFQCETCFKELKAAEKAINLIRQEGYSILNEKKFTANKRFFLPVLSSPLRWGIAFTSVALLAIILFLLFQNKQETADEKIITKDEKTIPSDQDDNSDQDSKDTLSNIETSQDKNDFANLTGPSFRTVPYLEEWITENVRSGNNKIDTILSPGIGEKFREENIIFKWKMIDKEIVSLRIFNNLEKEIFTSKPDQIQFPLLNVNVISKTFQQSGLYYWRLEDESEVLYVGKFYFLQKP